MGYAIWVNAARGGFHHRDNEGVIVQRPTFREAEAVLEDHGYINSTAVDRDAQGFRLKVGETTAYVVEFMERPTVAARAEEFRRAIAIRLTPAQRAEVDRRNATPLYAHACATHDFLDSNEVLAGIIDADNIALWDAVWTLAKRLGFNITVEETANGRA